VAREIVEAGGLHHSRARIATLPVAVRERTEMLLEYSIRAALRRLPERQILKKKKRAAEYLTLKYASSDQEVAGALFLDGRGGLICDKVFYRGTVVRSAIEPRLYFKEGFLVGATALVMFHNHPSGDPAFSRDDLLITRRIAEAGELIGISVADHIILGSMGKWASIASEGAWGVAAKEP
jgi:DNA repair protein RadC